jgi:hypothetical protein
VCACRPSHSNSTTSYGSPSLSPKPFAMSFGVSVAMSSTILVMCEMWRRALSTKQTSLRSNQSTCSCQLPLLCFLTTRIAHSIIAGRSAFDIHRLQIGLDIAFAFCGRWS